MQSDRPTDNAPERVLLESEIDSDPFEQFRQWFEEASQSNEHDHTAMTLATATPEGAPSARMVLLKGFDERGFVFYTNLESRKAKELDVNPRAALVFWWGSMQRQVRVEGSIALVAPAEADAYYHSRPLGSRIGAWASPQSKTISSRDELEEAVKKVEIECADGDIPRPPFWSGFRLSPSVIEFWQGRKSRLHDRLVFRKSESGWNLSRLAP
ncbi:MAG: pyridoxamine 5'-phosphate oxidase [bacterium]|nr:pyridoxamine 5'-phosphate oxidase [bacterium]